MLKKILTLTLAFVMLSVAVFSYGEYTLNAAYATTTGDPAVIAVDANNSDVTADGLTGSVTLNIASETAYDDAIVVTAVFDGADFLTAKIDTVDISATEENKPVITLPAAAPTESGEYNVKFFLWESKATLAPIAQPISFVAKHVVQLSTPWNGEAPTEADKPAYDEATATYSIANGNQLAWFAENAQSTDNAVLTNDIYLNSFFEADGVTFDADWSENGTEGANNWFNYRIGDATAYSGTFDGKGKTIYGMYINNNDPYLGGMFDTLNGATVKDLNIAGAYVVGSRNSTNAAQLGASVLAYELKSGTIDNVSVGGLIKATGTACGLVGSIVAKISTASSVTNCTSRVDIDLSAARVHATVSLDGKTSSGVGGIIGFITKGIGCTVTGNKNYGNINAPNNQFVAGILAQAGNGGACASFANNENHGDITGGTGFVGTDTTKKAYCAQLVAVALNLYVPSAGSLAWNDGDNGNVAEGSSTGLVTYTPTTEE